MRRHCTAGCGWTREKDSASRTLCLQRLAVSSCYFRCTFRHRPLRTETILPCYRELLEQRTSASLLLSLVWHQRSPRVLKIYQSTRQTRQKTSTNKRPAADLLHVNHVGVRSCLANHDLNAHLTALLRYKTGTIGLPFHPGGFGLPPALVRALDCLTANSFPHPRSSL